MGEFAKSLENTVRFNERRHPVRIDRRGDDRNAILQEALKSLEEHSDSIYPKATHVPAGTFGPSLAATAVTGLVINGTNLEGDGTKSSGESANSTGQLDLEAVVPGEQTLVVTVTVGAGATQIDALDVAAGTITINSQNGGATASALAVILNAHERAKFMVNASEGVAGDMDVAEAITVAGGEGDLTTLSVGGNAIDGTNVGNGITLTTPTAITFDLDISDIDGGGTDLVVGDLYSFDLRIDGVKTDLPNLVPIT